MTDVPARLPFASEEGATAELLRARRGGQLSALDRLLLHSPPVAEGWNALLGALRSGTTLPDDLRELVILRVAVLNGAAFEWTAHEPIARRAGLDDGRLAALRSPDAAGFPGWTPVQLAVLGFTDASTTAVTVPESVFAALREHLDDRQVVEVVTTVGGYAMVSRFLVALEVPPPEGEVAG
ncbi:MAG: carboxymuconolactone decarboxylase family protein [Actinomycetes bacterium]